MEKIILYTAPQSTEVSLQTSIPYHTDWRKAGRNLARFLWEVVPAGAIDRVTDRLWSACVGRGLDINKHDFRELFNDILERMSDED